MEYPGLIKLKKANKYCSAFATEQKKGIQQPSKNDIG